MPILPREINRQIERKARPDVVGEEGRLYRLEQGLYAKAWQGSHEASLYRHTPEELAVLSPYFAWRKFSEARLIHEASPANTLEMVMAYDSRVQRNSDGTYRFSDSTASPVTVSRAVEPTGNRPAERRRAIIERMYSDLEPLRDQIRQEGLESNAAKEYTAIFAQCEKKLHDLLQSPEFRLFQRRQSPALHAAEDLERDFRRMEKAVKKLNPRSPILRLLRYGITPIHPLVNFIPHDTTSGARPQGTFIEMVILDIHRYKTALQQDHPKDFAAREQKVDYYFVLTLLNMLYDRCTEMTTDTNLRRVMREDLFRMTERLRRIAAKRGMVVFVQLEQQVEQHLLRVLAASPLAADLQNSLGRIYDRLSVYEQ